VHKQGSTNISLVHHLDKNSSCQIPLNKSNWTYTCCCYCSTWGYVTSHNLQAKNEAPYVICIKDNIYCLNLLLNICGEIKGLVGKGRGIPIQINLFSIPEIHQSGYRNNEQW